MRDPNIKRADGFLLGLCLGTPFYAIFCYSCFFVPVVDDQKGSSIMPLFLAPTSLLLFDGTGNLQAFWHGYPFQALLLISNFLLYGIIGMLIRRIYISLNSFRNVQ
jgi:hypothetical protein